MQWTSRFWRVFLCFVLMSVAVFSTSAAAADTEIIDTDTASEGYFTVNYTPNKAVKVKIGITFDGKTVYHNYEPGTETSYSFDQGEGKYTITVYRNVTGTKYAKVKSEKVVVKMEDEMAPHLASTAEISFAEGDAVSAAAAALCEDKTAEADKVVAIHNYIAENFEYDYDFAAAVRRGEIKNYTPDSNATLDIHKGVCYDFASLFAAMCRSQGIACTMEKGIAYGGYHAWNSVYVDGQWVQVDLTASIAYDAFNADEVSDFTVNYAA